MSTLRILADQNMRSVAEYFAAMGAVSLIDGRKLVANDLSGVDVLLIRSVTKVNARLLAGSQIKFVGTATSGFDHIDTEYLTHNRIGFSHAPGSNANSVVEYVLAAISQTGDKLEQLLAGSPLGIIGYGNIGRALTLRCAALGISVRVYDPWLDINRLQNPATLSEVLSCEVVSIHAELTHNKPWQSYHLLAASHLAALGRETLLINAGRGEIIDSDALLKLHKRGSGPTTVLDVWEGEPAISSELLDSVTIGTPHIAGYSLDGKILATRMLRDAVAQYLKIDNKCEQELEAPADTLIVPSKLRSADLIRWAVNARYNIFEDDTALRSKTNASDGAAAADGFDELRKSYRARRELSGSTVSIQYGEQAQKDHLEALGCNIVMAD
jgi:erythronate-4-phosphate dehydrogenase